MRDLIGTYLDFPSPGVAFKDLLPILQQPAVMQRCIEQLAQLCQRYQFDRLAGLEARGFLFGMPLAFYLKTPFVPVRKAGKLPGELARQSYDLEYGQAVMEVQKSAVPAGTKVLVFDDLLATGGTLHAANQLLLGMGAEVVVNVCLAEITSLNGRQKFADVPLEVLLAL